MADWPAERFAVPRGAGDPGRFQEPQCQMRSAKITSLLSPVPTRKDYRALGYRPRERNVNACSLNVPPHSSFAPMMRSVLWMLVIVPAWAPFASASLPPAAAPSSWTRGFFQADTVRVDTACPAVAEGLQRQAPDTLAAGTDLLEVAPATAGSTAVNVVVEIPAGTAEKWEVAKNGRALAIEREAGRLRRINYLPYPANYGFIPRTRLGAEAGGDGDPVDVVLLGSATPCGAVVRARILGTLRLIDNGEQDDKILAVRPRSPLGDVRGIDDLQDRYPGVLEILETWFVHYKGAETRSQGFGGSETARSVVREAARQYTSPTGR
jgi:inorganic pyrophosphatase